MRISTLILFVFTMYSCGEGSGTQSASAPVMPANQGEEIFKSNCISCHGADGKLGVSGAADLSKSKISLDSAAMVILKGRNAMTGFAGKLKPEEIKQVAEYILTLRK